MLKSVLSQVAELVSGLMSEILSVTSALHTQSAAVLSVCFGSALRNRMIPSLLSFICSLTVFLFFFLS